MEGIELIKLPTIYCPFPSRINPHVEAVEEHSLQWAQRFQLVQKAAALQRFRAARFAWLAARTYPDATFEDLAVVNDFFIWLFMYDDQLDDGPPDKQPEQIQSVIAEFSAILAGKSTVEDCFSISSPTQQHVIFAAFADLWQRICPSMTIVWRKRFCDHLYKYFASYSWEEQNRTQSRLPDIDSYIKMRQNTGAMWLALDCIDITEHVSLPPEVYVSQEIQALACITINVVCWANDIVSLRKELARGDVNNLVVVICHARHCSLQEAVDIANAMITEQVQLFLEIEQNLPTFPPPVEQALAKHLEIMHAWMRGNLDWSDETQRYSQVETTEPGQSVSYLDTILHKTPPS